ncbi:MAG: tRNA lysidine(34) synthetase TilS [Candidatus Anammoximicrobium sp.]|nr:tRNA lysidine(34) synthetase TilS [Candidatus Anammoximicrobium sp.]
MSGSSVFERKLILAWPPPVWQDVTVLVAVSGGPDSVALLRGLAQAGGQGVGQLTAAHFNHGVRGAQAAADEAFVVELCRRLRIACQVGRAGEPGKGAGLRGEADLRAARYQFLSETARQVGARYVASGHTADDQAETVLHRIVRGTGIAGLAGIRQHRQLIPGVSLVRPLLTVSRREVLDYLAAIGQPYREDQSNADPRFTRNRIRHELLPHLAASYNPGVVGAVTRLAALAGEAQELVAGLAEDLADKCVTAEAPGDVAVDCAVLAAAPRFLVREVLLAVWRRQGWTRQAMSFERWEELAGLVLAPPAGSFVSKQVFPGSIAASREGRVLRLLAVPAPPPKSFS